MTLPKDVLPFIEYEISPVLETEGSCEAHESEQDVLDVLRTGLKGEYFWSLYGISYDPETNMRLADHISDCTTELAIIELYMKITGHRDIAPTGKRRKYLPAHGPVEIFWGNSGKLEPVTSKGVNEGRD